MKTSNNEIKFLNQLELNPLSKNTLTSSRRKIQPQLSMIWIKEFDGERETLVARWVRQD